MFAALATAMAGRWTLIDDFNAVPTGTHSTEASLGACQGRCDKEERCSQFSWNKHSHHCYCSTSTDWKGTESDHITSGCRKDRVPTCSHAPAPPTPSPPEFDGVLRNAGDGRTDAYLIPPFASNHASMVEQVDNGRLHMAWFSGTHEGQDGVAIVYSELNASSGAVGSAWSSAATLSQRKGYSNQNAVLYSDDKASVLHLFHSQQAGGKGESAATVWHLSAQVDAEGRTSATFTAPREIFSKPGSFDKNRVVERLDGSWLLPLYEQGKSPNYPSNAFLPAHEDPNDPKSWSMGSYSDAENLVQPSVVRLAPGSPELKAFFRDRKARNIYTSISHDDGLTWTKAKPNLLPNNNAGIHAWRLRSGRIALVYNPQTHGRDPLALSLSEDNGTTWKYTRILEQLDGKQEFSYPTIREDKAHDGVMHVSYTFKRKCIKYSRVTEAWAMATPY